MKKQLASVILAVVVVCLLIAPGCVSRSVYETLEARVAQMEKQSGQEGNVGERLNELEMKIDLLQKENQAWQRQLGPDGPESKGDLAFILDKVNSISADLQRLTGQVSKSTIDIVSLYDRCNKSVVAIRFWGQVQATGFVFSPQHIITCEYVIRGAPPTVQVILYDGTALDAQLLDSSRRAGTAVLWVQQELSPAPLPFGESSAVKVGEPILVMGNPDGHVRTASAGIISQTGATATFYEEIPGRPKAGAVKYEDLIQFDNAAGGSSSGAPLLNSRGEVVGMVKGGYVGVTSFAGPSDRIKEAALSIIESSP